LLLKHNLKHSTPAKGLQTKTMRRWLAAVPLPALDRLEMDLLLEQWQLHDAHLEKVNRQIEKRQAANRTAAIIASTPGIGAYSSLALASRIGRIERFATPGSLANYFGLTPGSRNSGEARQRLGSITKQGSSIVRFLLGQSITHVLRKDARMRQWYKGVRRRRGSKIARVAAMRKLVTVIWQMLNRQQAYRVVTGTLRAEEPSAA
jgi:transposase